MLFRRPDFGLNCGATSRTYRNNSNDWNGGRGRRQTGIIVSLIRCGPNFTKHTVSLMRSIADSQLPPTPIRIRRTGWFRNRITYVATAYRIRLGVAQLRRIESDRRWQCVEVQRLKQA